MKRLIFFSFMVFLAACTNRSGIPEKIIPPDRMQKIMMDVIMAEQLSANYLIRDSLKKDKVKANQELLEVIFKIHHTNRVEFKNSLNFYESRPDLNKSIFDSLAAYGNRHRNELFEIKPVKKPGTLSEK